MRNLLYRHVMGYQVHPQARIGLFTVIDVANAKIGRARIGPMCVFRGPFTMVIGDYTSIGPQNVIECGDWVFEEKFALINYARRCEIGNECLITTLHYIDATDSFMLGDRTWIAGRGSQFWTHGAGVKERSIRIGRDCYIGSRVAFTPGSSVGSGCLVALGSVVTGRMDDENCLIAGVPARIRRNQWGWRDRKPLKHDAGLPDEMRA